MGRSATRPGGARASAAAALLSAWAAALLSACAGPGATEVPPGREVVRTVPLGPEDALAGAEAEAGAKALAETLTAAMAEALPRGLVPEERRLFRRRAKEGAVRSASPLADLDLSGVSWGGGTVVTLVTDRHAIVSAHVPRPVGSTVRFYTREGWPVDREVAAKVKRPRLPDGTPVDIAVVALDAPVPGGVAVYPLPRADQDVMAALAREAPPLLVTFRQAHATVGTLDRVRAGGARLRLAASSRRLGLSEEVGHAAAWGDSGHPWFWVTPDGLVLAGHTHTDEGAGAGPNYADEAVRAAVEAAIAETDAADAAGRP